MHDLAIPTPRNIYLTYFYLVHHLIIVRTCDYQLQLGRYHTILKYIITRLTIIETNYNNREFDYNRDCDPS